MKKKGAMAMPEAEYGTPEYTANDVADQTMKWHPQAKALKKLLKARFLKMLKTRAMMSSMPKEM